MLQLFPHNAPLYVARLPHQPIGGPPFNVLVEALSNVHFNVILHIFLNFIIIMIMSFLLRGATTAAIEHIQNAIKTRQRLQLRANC